MKIAYCPKCETPVIKRIITIKEDYVYDCYNCKDQIAKEAVIFKEEELKNLMDKEPLNQLKPFLTE